MLSLLMNMQKCDLRSSLMDKQEKQRFISVDTFNRLNCLEIFEGDVLISRLPDPAGRACILPPSNKRRITAVDCTVVRFSSYNPVLFVAYSQTKLYQEKVEMAMAGSTRQRISRKELGEIPIPVFPTIEEQNTVASIFANMDAEIEALEQKLAKYRQVKQGMMQQLLTGKIRLV
jgi:type I restriction enzyme S subunit